MYSSLDRIDIVTRDPATGRTVHHQTDHRSAAEILAEPELSTIFALTRVLNARSFKPEAQALVKYVSMQAPPDELRAVIAAAGGEVALVDEVLKWDGALRTPGDLANEAFHKLAERVAEQRGLTLDEDGLEELEAQALAASPQPDAEGEIEYWTWVVQLAAFTGEVLRRSGGGGRWVQAERTMGTVPFVFESARDGAHLNPCGKAEKFLEQGERESPRQLLRLAEDAGVEKRPVMFTLKPGNWEGKGETLWRPVLANSAQHEPALPVLAYGEDLPSSFAIFLRTPERDQRVAEYHAEALQHLKTIEVKVTDLDLGELKMVAVGGNYFASEKLFDPDFMRSMHAKLGSEMLAVGVPRKGVLLITNGLQQPEVIGKFKYILERKHGENEASPALSPVPMIVMKGEVVGLIKLTSESEAPPPPPAPKKAGFLSRLFGKS